ncbi:MAG: hypothetical protein JKX97_08415 [Candidatus Lindowbacteria bacterium]|nr:hypothetical protein [Candidatus Lindowbacteria bacterium]
MEIKFNREKRFALTEKCKDVDGFIKSVRGGNQKDLADHLAKCPTCRKVALDAVSALMSEGLEMEPPAIVKKIAKRVMHEGGAQDKILAILCVDGKIDEVQGGEYRIAEQKHRVSFVYEKEPYPFQLDIELDELKMIVKVHTKNPTDAVANLSSKASGPVSLPRKLQHSVTWPNQDPGRYDLKITGKNGSSAVSLHVIQKAKFR